MASDEIAPRPPNGTRKLNSEARAAGVTRDYIAVARGSDLVVIRVVGQGTMLTAPALAQFAERQLKAGFRRFVFDLERCRGLDSTFLGMMVGIQMVLGGEEVRPSGPPLTLPSPQEGEGGVRGQMPPDPPAAMPLRREPRSLGAPWAERMSPDEAVAALKVLFADPASAAAELAKAAPLPSSPSHGGEGAAGGPPAGQPKPPGCLVSAVNVPPDLANLMAMLGVDKFVRLRGTYDLGQLETAILAEKDLPPDEQRRLILKAHNTLIEIDARNEARFGPFLKSLSKALGE